MIYLSNQTQKRLFLTWYDLCRFYRSHYKKKIQILMDIKKVLLQWFISFLIKKTLLRVQINLLVVVLKWKYIKPKITWRITLTNYGKFVKRKVYSSFIDIIWGDDRATMQLLSTFNEETCFLWSVIDIYSKYT